MISFTESANTVEYSKHFVILPSFREYSLNDYINKTKGGKKVKKQFSYSSDKNKHFLKPEEIRKIISNLDI